jgi:hypothetical protein
MFTSIIASTCGGGIGMRHSWSNVMVPELVRWTGVPIRGIIYSRWDTIDPRYNSVTDDVMMMDQWKSIKHYFKLNNNIISKQKGQEGYDPCTKYDFIYKCLVTNMNYLTLVADGDGTIDETLWGFGGYGSKACTKLMGKQVNKGSQTILFYDIHRRYLHGYIHCHKLQP